MKSQAKTVWDGTC